MPAIYLAAAISRRTAAFSRNPYCGRASSVDDPCKLAQEFCLGVLEILSAGFCRQHRHPPGGCREAWGLEVEGAAL